MVENIQWNKMSMVNSFTQSAQSAWRKAVDSVLSDLVRVNWLNFAGIYFFAYSLKLGNCENNSSILVKASIFFSKKFQREAWNAKTMIVWYTSCLFYIHIYMYMLMYQVHELI